jgi:hypothetical protein
MGFSPSKNGRKYSLALLGIFVLTFMSVLALYSGVVASILPTFIGGLLGLLGLYFSGNIANKHVTGRNERQGQVQPQDNKEGED